MSGSTEINKNELLEILEQMTSTQFKKFILKLDVPRNLIPSLDRPQTEIAVNLLYLAEAPGGCRLEKIKQTLEGMGINLGKLPCTSKDPNKYKIAKANLFKSDYKKTLKIFEEVVKQLETGESAGIFILQECWSQGGKYCHRRLINYLKDSTAESKFHLFNVNYLGGEISQKGLLYRLLCELKNDQSETDQSKTERDLEELTEEDVIKEIEILVPQKDSGHTYLFHIKGYDYLLKKKNFWNWFFNQFWNCLIQDFLPKITQNHRCLKLIFLFESQFMDMEVAPNYLYSFPEAFTRNKIVNLPLEPCDIGEIRNWLYKFSFLPQSMINNILNNLMVTDKKPDTVDEYIQQQLDLYFSPK